MRRLFFLLTLLACAAFRADAQYVPNSSQAFQFMSLYNPAFTGIEPFDDFKLGYRYQWLGFGKNAPKFINLSFQKRIKQPLDLLYNAPRMSDFSGGKAERIPKNKRIIHSVGVNVFQSRIGILKSIGSAISYAFSYPLSGEARLAGGAAAMVENRRMDVAEVTVRDPDPFYDHLLKSSTAQTDLNVRAGLLLYGENFYVGVSYLPLLNVALQASDIAMDDAFFRGSVQLGYSFPVSADVSLRPSVVGLVQMNNALVVDYSLKALIQEKVWAGLTYRDVESAIGMLGFNINERFSVSYSFELSVGDFRRFDDGSHELVLAARLNNLKRFTQYLW